MPRSRWPRLVLLLVLVLAGCRSGAPPNAGASAPGVVAQRGGDTAQLVDKLVIDDSCSDFSNEADQIVCITNKSGSTVDISAWLIRNTLGRTYYFPSGTKLEPNASVKVHTGAGTNDAQNLYWNYEFKPVFDRKEQIVLVSTDNIDIDTFTTP